MKLNTINEEWNVLKTFFPEGWEEKAFETRALIRRRNIDSPETLLRVLLIHLADGKSLRTTATFAKHADLCNINDSALLHRLKSSGEWFRWMANQLYKRANPQLEVPDYAKKNRVRMIDASMISEPGSTGSDWRLHYSINLSDLRCDEFEVTDFRVGESFTNFSVNPDELLVADRAYCNKKGIFHVLEAGGHVLVRFHSTALPLCNYRGKPISILEKLKSIELNEVGDWDVYLTKEDGKKVKGRICAIRKSKEATEKTRKEILKEASKKQRKVKAETLEFAEYVIVFTTMNRHRLKSMEVMELYRSRWQVELSFKRLKGIMGLGHLHKHDPESCKAWLYGKIFVSLLVEGVYRECETFSPWGYPFGRI